MLNDDRNHDVRREHEMSPPGAGHSPGDLGGSGRGRAADLPTSSRLRFR